MADELPGPLPQMSHDQPEQPFIESAGYSDGEGSIGSSHPRISHCLAKSCREATQNPQFCPSLPAAGIAEQLARMKRLEGIAYGSDAASFCGLQDGVQYAWKHMYMLV